MVLKAPDELRHEWDNDPLWRESWYYNFSDPQNEIGAWLYLWVVPNQPLKSGMLVCFYHGVATDFDSTEAAWKSPGHLLRGANDSWVYCYKRDVAELMAEGPRRRDAMRAFDEAARAAEALPPGV
jgi:hypothetical protein